MRAALLLWFCDWVIGLLLNVIKAKNALEKYVSVYTHEILNIVLGEVCVQLGFIDRKVRNPSSDIFKSVCTETKVLCMLSRGRLL